MSQSSEMSEARSYRDFASYYGSQGRDRDYRQTGAVGDMLGAFSDWDRSGGYGGGCCCGGGGYGSTSASFFSDGTLFALLAGAALAFYILYTTITMANAAGGGRKRRGAKKTEEDDSPFVGFEDIVWQGLEEFEEKIDRIAEGQDTGDDNWISKIYNQFSFFNDVDNKLTESDLDGIEPPILDETWGLGIRNSSVFKANTTVEEPVKLDSESRSKREVHEEDFDQEEDAISDPEEKCRVDMWRCLSRVIEGGLHYIDHPEGIYSLAKKTMFKVAFHGGVTNVWSGLMTIPEARHIKKCMSSHSECISYEVLRREAQETMDPTDPNARIYQKKESGKTVAEQSQEKVVKKDRLIIVPEFVESLDQGDGSQQFDDDDYSDNQL